MTPPDIPLPTNAARPYSVQGSGPWQESWTPLARRQLHALLDLSPPEAVGLLRERLTRGLLDGGWTWGQNGDCGCVIGTLAEQIEGPDIVAIYARSGLLRSATPTDSIEAFVYPIRVGETPDKNDRARVLLDWLDAWEASR